VAVSHAVARQRGRPTAWWGMLVLIASEATLFAALIGSYTFLRFQQASWPPDGIAPPDVARPVVVALLLALTSIPLQLASRGAQARRLGRTRLLLAVALAVQAGYLAYQLHGYRDGLDRLPVSRDAYASIYQTLLGVDHAHVAVALLLVLWLLWKLRRGFTTYRVNAALAIAWYGHFVNLATLLVTAALLSARL
jgi:heme/copper-type cytochrome/quinol oxidase subunit 3